MAQKTIYKYSDQLGKVISKNVPDFDVSYYESLGWSTSKPSKDSGSSGGGGSSSDGSSSSEGGGVVAQ